MVRLKAIVSLSALTLLFPPTTHAYLDPGTGSYVFQMILALALSAAFTVKVYWGKLVSIFRKAPEDSEKSGAGQQGPERS